MFLGFSADQICCLFHVSKTFYALDLTIEVTQIRAEDGTIQVYCQSIPESTEIEMHLSIKLSKKSFGEILRPKSATRTLIKGLTHGPRAISSLT